MQKSLPKCLSQSLEDHISLWRTRRETLVWLVALIVLTGTVSLWRLAGYVDTRARTLSVHRRFERFFQHVHLDEASVARLIVHIMGLSGKPWHLALDFQCTGTHGIDGAHEQNLSGPTDCFTEWGPGVHRGKVDALAA